MVIPRGHHQKEAGPPSSGNALSLVPYLLPLETISSSLPILWESIASSTVVQLPATMALSIPCAILWESIRLFYSSTAPCNYGFIDSLCDFVGINSPVLQFYSSLQLWLYRFLVGETRQSDLPILAGRSSKKRNPCLLKIGSERCGSSSWWGYKQSLLEWGLYWQVKRSDHLWFVVYIHGQTNGSLDGQLVVDCSAESSSVQSLHYSRRVGHSRFVA